VTAEYVRQRYNVDYKVGERLHAHGRTGKLVSFPGRHLGIRFDDDWTCSQDCQRFVSSRPEVHQRSADAGRAPGSN